MCGRAELLFATEAEGAMAEVGLLPFVRIALQVCRAVLPRYRSRFSKHQFTQPQLLAILCLMRYEDWTFREAEVRLGEHRELRHDSVSLPPAFGRSDHRSRGGRDRAPVAWFAASQPQARSCGRRCNGLGPGSSQHVLCATEASSRAETAAVETLVEVGGRGGFGSAVCVVADRAAGSLERLREFACRRRSGFPANAHRIGAGRRRVRQRKESHLHSTTTRGAERDPGQARQENLAPPWSPRRNASARAPGRSLRTQKRQALLLGLSFNLYRLKHRRPFLRMSTEPSHLCSAPFFRALVVLTPTKFTRSKEPTTSSNQPLRDIEELIAIGVIEQGEAGGRSTSYRLTRNFERNIGEPKANGPG